MLSGRTPEQLVELLLPGWMPPNPAVRMSNEAERMLTAMPPAVVRNALLSGMRSSNRHVRDACGRKLSAFVDPEVANVMLAALKDENGWVRTHAASYFAFSAGPSDVPNSDAVVNGFRDAINRESEDGRKKILQDCLQRFLSRRQPSSGHPS
jgi:hypothetical protein